MIATTTELLPLLAPPSTHQWFSSRGCVVDEGEGMPRAAYIGGTLIGTFGVRERNKRNAILMGLCADPNVHLGRLAKAFGISDEALRQMRRQYETEGLEAVLARRPGGSEGKVDARLRRRLEGLFEQGLSVSKAHRRVSGKVSRSTVGVERAAWARRRALPAPTTEIAAEATPVVDSEPLPLAETVPVESTPTEAACAVEDEAVAASGCAEEGDDGREAKIAPKSMSGGRWVQHAGAWLLIAMLAKLGLHKRAEAVRGERVEAGALRIALDAVAAALALGQGCVEGVRRLATPSAPTLLRADHAPSASWVRRVLGRFAQKLGSARLHLAMVAEYVHTSDDPVVFYIDNHLRPYTGQGTIRKGWRMQDKRVLPGVTDYYVHDEDGRPVLRIAVASHDSLTQWLPRIAKILREALGDEAKILLAFDRGGAFPEHMAGLREQGFDFVTYERKPFRTLPPSDFDQTIVDGDEQLGVCDRRINLGHGRGRVRRIALRMPDERRVHVLAVSSLPAARLYAILRGRWRQENAFKHGVERWGLNQLDGRTTHPYPSDAIIPNPARRRLDHALRIARVREGNARRELAKLDAQHPRHARWQQELREALAQQQELEALRPKTPKSAPLAETELADKLAMHPDEYKMTIDTVRVACANVESELACMLAEHLRVPAEAKRALANLFAAPGAIHIGQRHVTVHLQPAGNKNELRAFVKFLRRCNQLRLIMPGDDKGRLLRLRLQLS
jgi:hypothetical protein